MLIFLVCSSQSILPEKISSIPTPTPNSDIFRFPTGLFCSEIPTGLGSSWQGITIGKSSISDLEVYIISLSEGYQAIYRSDRVIFDLPGSTMNASFVEACVRDGIILLLSIINGDSSPIYLKDIVTEHGVPNAVTWTVDARTRVVFWFEQGLAAEVMAPTGKPSDGRVVQTIYFPCF